jgi:hypothetical protein
MTVKNGQHQLVGLVSLGGLYDDMKLIETGDHSYKKVLFYFKRMKEIIF